MLHRAFAAVALFLALTAFSSDVHAFDVSETLAVERYTILDDGTLEYAAGNLLRSGQFRVLISYPISTFGIPLSDYEPISGRPIVLESFYEAHKAVGAIPRWVRSQDVFYLGLYDYVIVGVSGKGDPNPIPFVREQPQNERVLLGDEAFFFVEAGPEGYLSYQWRHRNKVLPG